MLRERIDGQTAESFVVRPACVGDRVALAVVAAATWRATYGDIFTLEFIADFVQRAYGPERLTRIILAPDSRFLVATADEAVIGFGQMGPAFMRREGAASIPADLHRLYVLPEWQRRGVGRALLAELEVWLANRGMHAYGCFVHSRNARAIAFYTAQGFVNLPDRDHQDEWYMVKGLMR